MLTRLTEENGNARSYFAITHHESVIVLVAHDSDVEHCKRREQNDLQDGVERHQNSAIIAVALCQIIPYQNHCDATGNTNEYQAVPEIWSIGKKSPSQSYHKKWCDNPIEDERDTDLYPQLSTAEKQM